MEEGGRSTLSDQLQPKIPDGDTPNATCERVYAQNKARIYLTTFPPT